LANLEVLSSSLFSKEYPVEARVIKSNDIVYRKNKDFAEQSIAKSGFSKIIISLINQLPEDCIHQIMGDVKLIERSEASFCSVFLQTQCKHYINFHDEKMCTVEFLCKFTTTIEVLSSLSEDVLRELHLDITTPVGSVQI